MRLHFFLSLLKIFAFILSIAIFSPACSKDTEQVEEEVDDEGEGDEGSNGASASEELADAEDEKTDEAAAPAPNVAAPTEQADAGAIADAEPQATEMDKTAQGPTESIATDDAAATPAPAAVANETFNGERHVYYIKSNGAKMRAQASNQAPVVGSLAKGDHVVAVVNGNWAQLENGHFIAMAQISKRGVGRSRAKNPWRSSK